MSIRAALGLGRAPEHRQSLQNGDPWLVQMLGRGTQTAAGTWVTPDSALRLTAVYRAVQVISTGVAMLPLVTYRRLDPTGKRRAIENPLYSTLHDLPNSWQTSFEWREMMTGHVLLRGNAYSEIFYRGDGSIGQLIPLNPDRTRPFRRPDSSIAYEFTPISGPRRIILADEMMHLRGFSNDGLVGLSPVALMREAVGLGMAGEEFEARFFSNDATPTVALTHPKTLTAEAAKRLKQSWQEANAGLPNAHKVAVLEEGLDIKTIGLTNRDAEFMALRKFQISEIARMFGVPPHMLGDLDRATFSNIEQQSLEFVIYCLMPWLRRWEGVISRDLMSAKARAIYFAEFLVDALLRGDVAARGAFYVQMLQNGVYNPNEVREMENKNPREGGDTYRDPMAEVPEDEPDTPAKPGLPAPAPAPGKKPGKKSAAPDPSEEEDDERYAYAELVESHREFVSARAKRIVNKEVTALRRMAKKHPPNIRVIELRDEIEKFYSDFEAGAEHIGESRRELREALVACDMSVFEALLTKWAESRAEEITTKEIARWQN